MKTKKAADIILYVFLTFMLVFTFFGKDLYRLTIPKVVAESAKRKSFPAEVETPEGIFQTKKVVIAVPEEAISDGFVYALNESEQGAYVTYEEVETGKTDDGWVEILKGIGARKKVIVGSDRVLYDGREVIVLTEQTEQIRLHTEGTAEEKEAFAKKCKKHNIQTVLIAMFFAVAGAVTARLLLRKRLRILFAPLMVVLCLLLCYYFRAEIEFPAEGIPEKLIDIHKWIKN